MFPSVSGQTHSDDNWGWHKCMCIQNIIRNHAADYLLLSFLPFVFCSVLGLCSPASGSWQSMQFQGWTPSCGMGLKLDTLVGNSHNFWTAHTLTHVVGRINCRLKVMWPDWGSNSSQGILACLQAMISSGYISPISMASYLGSASSIPRNFHFAGV